MVRRIPRSGLWMKHHASASVVYDSLLLRPMDNTHTERPGHAERSVYAWRSIGSSLTVSAQTGLAYTRGPVRRTRADIRRTLADSGCALDAAVLVLCQLQLSRASCLGDRYCLRTSSLLHLREHYASSSATAMSSAI
ncbi:hypothetical protein C8Q79DRAFT_608322 [Trametes meyenii]|nr:hypothetical protein C8Q79DRAFT_608322 [Trametes meyenii]